MALLNNTAVQTPGADYNTDVRPGLGLTYSDLIFGETVKQLTNHGENASQDDMYAHCWANSDGTMYFDNGLGSLVIRRTSDGASVATGQPGNNFDTIWHPTESDYYLYRSGTSLICYSVSGQSTVWSKDFGSTLQSLGGSINWVDKTGRYYIVRYGDAGHVYDQTEDVIYSGSITGDLGAGYLGMSPDGAYALQVTNTGLTSFALNHTTNTIPTGVYTMPRGVSYPVSTSHAVYISASDGKNYGISTFSNLDAPDGLGFYAYDLSIDRSSMDSAAILADVTGANGRLIFSVNHVTEIETHMTHGPNGSGQDWIFIDTEDQRSTDDFDATPTDWQTYRQEILAVNVLDSRILRLAHHRSRSVQDLYYYQPRISCAWDASLVIWTSNMNDDTPSGYNDTFGIENPLAGLATADFIMRVLWVEMQLPPAA